MKPYEVARLLRKTATRITMLDVMTSGNPERIARYLCNRAVYRLTNQATDAITRRLFGKGGRRK